MTSPSSSCLGEAMAIPWIYSLKVWVKHNLSARSLSGSRSGAEEYELSQLLPCSWLKDHSLYHKDAFHIRVNLWIRW